MKMKIIDQYATIVLGATVRGCGVLSANPGALLLEPRIQLGVNWCLCFDRGKNWRETPPVSPAAEEFASALFTRYAVANDKLCNPAVAYILADMAHRHKWHVKLDLGFLSAAADRVQIRDAAGVTEFRAQRIIDARPVYTERKVLTALFKGEPGLPEQTGMDYCIRPGFLEDQYDLQLSLPVRCSWSEARERVGGILAELKEKDVPLKLALIGSCFAEKQFDNAIAEFNCGVRLGEGK